ncbi:unknown [Clostridium sp. CAG:451]|nr:unknown [Clostridium sp. CAG:451]
MNQEREKYLDLKTKLYNIIDEIDNVNDTYNNLKGSLITNILIDNKVPQEEALEQNIRSIKQIKYEIKNIIYSEINDKF